MLPTPFLAKVASFLAAAALVGPAVLTGPATGHYYGTGHADMTWTTTGLVVSGAGASATLTTTLATFGQAIAFGMPVSTLSFTVDTAVTPPAVTGQLVLDVPPSTDPWWATYPGPTPLPGVTTGGQVSLNLTGSAEQHPAAVTLFGTYTIAGATGQYAGITGAGHWNGATTGGPGSFGQFFDFAVIGHYV